MSCENSLTWPYPIRLSELSGVWEKEDFEPRLELSEYQREVLQSLEAALYADLKEIKKKKVEKEDQDVEEISQRRQEIMQGYWDRNGNIEGFLTTERKRREINEESLQEKIEEYRGFKALLKELLREFDGDNDFAISMRYVLEIYKRYVNVKIAEAIVESDWNPRNTERVDKFVNGVFTEKDEKGDFLVLGEMLRKRVENVEKMPNEDYKYPDVWLDQDDIEVVAKCLLKEVGLGDWKVIRRSGDKSTFGVIPGKKEVRIGKIMRRRIEEVLPVIAHEVEGHALKTVGGQTFKIMEKYSAGGREGVSSEMSGRWIEDQTRILMGLRPKLPETAYFRMMEMKKGGASFVECFDYCFKNRSKKIGYQESEVFNNKEKYAEIFDYAYDRTMRIFRRRASLSEHNNYLASSDQLKYLEQMVVLEKLFELGLEKTMFVDGMDLYALKELSDLGVLNDIDEKGCDFVMAKKIWPTIEAELKEGKEIKQIISGLR